MFICPYAKDCKASHKDVFYEGQLHHVGNHYDLTINGHPFRTVVIGQEYGHGPCFVSMEDRSQMVLEQTGLLKTFTSRNPHMRGTTSVLRLLFGIPLGSTHCDEFLQTIDGDKIHLFDAFALVNYLLCSAVSTDDGRRGKSTPIMRENCLEHFTKVLEILQPNVAIVQGKSFWASIQKAFNKVDRITDTLYIAEINQHELMVAVFAHPSTPDNNHNWGRDAKTPYLQNVVVPTIKKIQQYLLQTSTKNGDCFMSTPLKLPLQQSKSQKSNVESQPFNAIFEQIYAGILQRYPSNITYQKPKFEHSTPNRMRIYINGVKGSHYEICFHRAYFEFALHFESSPAKDLERCQAFDQHLSNITEQVGLYVKSGPLEKKGRMRVWYESNHELIDQEKISLYIDQYSRFINATLPILIKVYSA